MRDFQNAFDAALAGVDSTIVEVMGHTDRRPD